MRLTALGLLFVAPWPNAMNGPAFTGALFVLSGALLWALMTPQKRRGGARNRGPASRIPAPRLFALAAAAYCAVLGWTLLQALPVWPAAIAHPAWAAIGLAPAPVSASPGLTLDAFMLLASYGLVFAYMAREATDPDFARRALRVIGAAAALCGLAGLIALSSGDVMLSGAAKHVYRGRLTGPFVNANLVASYLALGLVALLALAAPAPGSAPRAGWRGQVRRADAFLSRKALPTAGVIVTASALLLTGSRGGVVAGGVGVGVLAASGAVRAARSRRGAAAPLAAGLAAGLAVVVFVAASSGGALDRRLAQSAFASEGRKAVYALDAAMAQDRWLAGHGLGAFQDAVGGYYSAANAGLKKPFLYAHNLYAEAVIGLGAPAAAVLFLAVGLIIAHCAAGLVRRRSANGVYPAAAIAGAAVVGAHGLIDDPLALPAVAATFAAILGVGYGQSPSRAPAMGRDR